MTTELPDTHNPERAEVLLERLRSTAHWHLTEGNGDDATHQALQAAISEIERLRAALAKANDQAEHFERAWYLRGDVLENLANAAEDAARVARLDEARRWAKSVDELTLLLRATDARYMALAQQVADGRAMQPAQPILGGPGA